jgi:tRNA-dihydrouridine synthase C
MKLMLAPMEGLLDFTLRDILTRVGGMDRCVSEFIRITDQLLPARVFTRIVPELLHGSRTPAGTPVRPQLLGSDPSVPGRQRRPAWPRWARPAST